MVFFFFESRRFPKPYTPAINSRQNPIREKRAGIWVVPNQYYHFVAMYSYVLSPTKPNKKRCSFILNVRLNCIDVGGKAHTQVFFLILSYTTCRINYQNWTNFMPYIFFYVRVILIRKFIEDLPTPSNCLLTIFNPPSPSLSQIIHSHLFKRSLL